MEKFREQIQMAKSRRGMHDSGAGGAVRTKAADNVMVSWFCIMARWLCEMERGPGCRVRGQDGNYKLN